MAHIDAGKVRSKPIRFGLCVDRSICVPALGDSAALCGIALFLNVLVPTLGVDEHSPASARPPRRRSQSYRLSSAGCVRMLGCRMPAASMPDGLAPVATRRSMGQHVPDSEPPLLAASLWLRPFCALAERAG